MLRAYFCRTFVIGKKIMDFRSAVEVQMRGNDMSVLSEKLSHGVAIVAVPATDHLAQQPFDLGPILQTNASVSHAPITLVRSPRCCGLVVLQSTGRASPT